ncbi:MAG: glycosyltransferase family 4 protein [Lachnospiraceae bacterium]|nr:glycosyltransferase family 4 protein [Lachnospiraceae bacterium]
MAEKPMKILVVSHEFPPIGGGGANACYHLTKGLADRGHQVTVVTANYRHMPARESIQGVQLIRVSSLRKHREHCSFKEMLSYLWKALQVTLRMQKKENYDVCLVFFGIPSGPIGYVLKKIYKLPYIIRFGGGDIPGTQERFAIIYKLLGPAIKAIWRNADALVANSQGLKDRAQDFYAKKDFDIICNGVNTDIFYPSDKEKTGEFCILFVSRLIERKGLQFIIPELGKIQEKVNRNIRLIIVGNGPYREELEKLVKECGIEKFVRFEGQKNRDELLLYYQSADVFILPSMWEGMPNVVLEAMACGLPIVMTPCEGSKELISNNGYVVPVEGFSDQLIFLANNSEACLEMGRESKRIVDSCFTWDKKVQEYISILENNVERK